ncbi:hypothetical protein QOZ80_9BG0703720 [Eleusine coracana subsp. coracana]|nr:hypothetical protein QOZ80_9BG0703720 [Eleusine coracana subsp. coracana]
MKRKNNGTTDLREFMARATAKKKQSKPVQSVSESVTQPSSNESQMLMVVFQDQSDSGTNTTVTPITEETPITQDDVSIPVDESECSDDDNSNEYHIEHDPGWRALISSYPVNDQDSVRRAYIAIRPCRPRMKKENFAQHKCGGKLKSLIIELSMMLVKEGKVSRYDIVYKLLKLVLILPVATAGAERVFSTMNFIKNKLQSKMGQKYLNGCLITFIEREFFLQAKNEGIITYFQSIKNRKVKL